jgi:uncharacterized membrane protein YqiK
MAAQQGQGLNQIPLLKDGRFCMDERVALLLRTLAVHLNAQCQKASGQQQQAVQQQLPDFVATLEDFENFCDAVHTHCTTLKQKLTIQEATASAEAATTDTGTSADMPSATGTAQPTLQQEERETIQELEKAMADLCDALKRHP